MVAHFCARRYVSVGLQFLVLCESDSRVGEPERKQQIEYEEAEQDSDVEVEAEEDELKHHELKEYGDTKGDEEHDGCIN